MLGGFFTASSFSISLISSSWNKNTSWVRIFLVTICWEFNCLMRVVNFWEPIYDGWRTLDNVLGIWGVSRNQPMHIYTFLHMLLRPSFLRLGQCLTLAALLVAKKLGRCQAVPWGEDLPGKHQGGWGAIGEGEGVKTTPNSASQPLFTRSPSPSHIVNNFLTQLFLPAGDKNHPKLLLFAKILWPCTATIWVIMVTYHGQLVGWQSKQNILWIPAYPKSLMRAFHNMSYHIIMSPLCCLRFLMILCTLYIYWGALEQLTSHPWPRRSLLKVGCDHFDFPHLFQNYVSWPKKMKRGWSQHFCLGRICLHCKALNCDMKYIDWNTLIGIHFCKCLLLLAGTF